MSIRFRRGMGADLNANMGAALNSYCNSWVGYIDPVCWGASNATAAGRAIAYGDSYPAPPAPPTVGSTLPGGAPIPAVPPVLESPELTAVNAAQMAGSIVDQQGEAWQAQNAGFFSTLNQQLNDGGFNWLLWGGVALGVFAVFSFAGGSPRRYGR